MNYKVVARNMLVRYLAEAQGCTAHRLHLAAIVVEAQVREQLHDLGGLMGEW